MNTWSRPLVALAVVLGLGACAAPGEDVPLAPQAKAAIIADDLPTVEAAVAAGFDPASDLGAGYESLLVAASAGADDIVEYLLGLGVEVDARGGDGSTALMFAAAFADASTVNLLVDAGASQTATDDLMGATALHYATFNDNVETVRALVAAGADLSATRHGGETALNIASRHRVQAIVDLLEAAGAPAA